MLFFFFLSLQGGLWKIIIHVSLISTFFSTIPSYKSEPYLHFLIPVFSFQSYSDRKPVQSRLQKVSLQQKVCFHLIYIFKQKVLISKLVINEGTCLQFLKINNQTKLVSPVTYISDCQCLDSWYFFKTKKWNCLITDFQVSSQHAGQSLILCSTECFSNVVMVFQVLGIIWRS